MFPVRMLLRAPERGGRERALQGAAQPHQLRHAHVLHGDAGRLLRHVPQEAEGYSHRVQRSQNRLVIVVMPYRVVGNPTWCQNVKLLEANYRGSRECVSD